MLRRRDVAASPVRRADEAWTVIVELIADTLDRSAAIDRADVLDAFGVAAIIGPRLVAARHLEKSPVVLVAELVHLSICTVSGVEAISIEENLGPVPGGSSASTWRVHLPAPDPLNADITAAVRRLQSPHHRGPTLRGRQEHRRRGASRPRRPSASFGAIP
jgi:hypothetical protein